MKSLILNSTKADQIYDYLKEAIINGEIKPKAKLIVKKIADQMGVSEIPVREALIKLEASGLVESKPYTGTVVTKPSVIELKENIEIRSALQSLAIELSAPLLSEEDILYLEDTFTQMEEIVSSDDYDRYTKINRDFHWRLYSKCPNKRLLALINDLWAKTERAKSVFRFQNSSMAISYAEHGELVKAIKEKKFDLAVLLERKHQLRVGEEIKESLTFI